ncbi:MAG: NUDIX domain-containing protein [Patescibacteria group bacterium]
MKIVIVDEKDNVIGYKDRDAINYQEDIYRVSALWITNSKGDILLAKRALTKSHSPGKWGPAVSGTVDEGEDYDLNIIKEAEEEIGLTNISPRKGFKKRISGKYNYFCQWYFAIMDKPVSDFKIKKDEVEEVKWFPIKELIREMENQPDKFTGSISLWKQLW